MITFIGVWRSPYIISDTKWLIGETECRSWLCFKLGFFSTRFSLIVTVSVMRYRCGCWYFLQLVSVSLMRYRYCYWFHHSTSLSIGNALTMWLLLYNPSLYLLRVKHIVVSCFILHSWSLHRLCIYDMIVD